MLHGAWRVTQQLPGYRQCSRHRPRRSPGCLCSCMLPCSVHSSSAQHRAVGNLWRGRNNFFLHHEIHRSPHAVLNNLHHHAERENKQKPNAKPPTWRAKCRRGKSPAGWRNAPALILRGGGGLSVLPVGRRTMNSRTRKSLEWFGPPERNTLLNCVMYSACLNLCA
jgi:hypothetical protein